MVIHVWLNTQITFNVFGKNVYKFRTFYYTKLSLKRFIPLE